MPDSIKAVFFDLDETLVLTGNATEKAYIEVANLAQNLAPKVDTNRLIESWKRRFGESPWDPDHQVDVEVWRGRHWEQALMEQGLGTQGLGDRLQACFQQQRLLHLRLEPGDGERAAGEGGWQQWSSQTGMRKCKGPNWSGARWPPSLTMCWWEAKRWLREGRRSRTPTSSGRLATSATACPLRLFTLGMIFGRTS
eukprot:jgi/Botrbrau1/21262/Bobra.39_2s0053.1